MSNGLYFAYRQAFVGLPDVRIAIRDDQDYDHLKIVAIEGRGAEMARRHDPTYLGWTLDACANKAVEMFCQMTDKEKVDTTAVV